MEGGAAVVLSWGDVNAIQKELVVSFPASYIKQDKSSLSIPTQDCKDQFVKRAVAVLPMQVVVGNAD